MRIIREGMDGKDGETGIFGSFGLGNVWREDWEIAITSMAYRKSN
jgi:hypothetical protein